MRYLVIISLFFLAFSCGNSKKVAHQKNEYALIVSFISKGAGPDVKAQQALTQYVGEFETANSVKLPFEKVNWGKEGETDYCFDMDEISKEKQTLFIKEVRSRLSFSDRVSFQENAVCKYKK